MKKLFSLVVLMAIASATVTISSSAHAAIPNTGLVKSPSHSAIYYKASNGKRYVFPNEKTYFTWYQDFSSVVVISESELASLPIGGNVTYRPGVKLLKVTSDPKVYAIAGPKTLRWVSSESVARNLYGASWFSKVDDLPDTFFTNYELGDMIAETGQFSPQSHMSSFASLSLLLTHGSPADDLSSQQPIGQSPMIGACSVFPSDNAWNTDISSYPVHKNSANYLATIGIGGRLHPDFGTEWEGDPIGIPYRVVKGVPKVPINFTLYGDESDPGPYPIPLDTEIEGGPSSDGDRHVSVVDESTCTLYELGRAYPKNGSWDAEVGAVWDLKTNSTRPQKWTSVDAAGLPILPGLVRYDEVVEKGVMSHAVRFTVSKTQRAYIAPASHYASNSTNENYPPMGLRLRMRAGYDCSGLSKEVQVLCATLKKYGMIVADNGSNWYITGAHDDRWNDEHLNDIKSIPGSAFEAVDTGPIIK